MKARTYLLLSILLGIASQIRAQDTYGADISWKRIKDQSLLVTVNFYGDCNGCGTCSLPGLTVGSVGGSLKYTGKLVSTTNITPVCSSQCTPCSGSCGAVLGVTKSIINYRVNLDSVCNSCCAFILNITACNRSSQTVLKGQCMVVESMLNKCLDSSDHSPVFVNDPKVFSPVGSDFITNLNVFDSDTTLYPNDSFMYSFSDPMQSGSKVSYPGSYTFDKPLYFLGFPKNELPLPRGFHLDSISGQLAFRPMKVEGSMFVIKAEQYRNKQLIGYVKRDYGFVSYKSTNNAPELSVCSGSPPPKSLCVGQELCFKICVSDADSTDSVALNWLTDIKGAKIVKTNSGPYEELTFCWTPTNKDVRSTPYNFAVQAKDNGCPFFTESTTSFSINVYPAFKLSIDTATGSCGEVEISSNLTAGADIANIIWNIGGSRKFTSGKNNDTIRTSFHIPGKKYIRATATNRNYCILDIFDSIQVRKFNYPVITDTMACQNSSFKLHTSLAKPNPKALVWWITGDTARTTNYQIQKKDSKAIVYFDDGKCNLQDTIQIKANISPSVDLKTAKTCSNRAAKLGFTLNNSFGDLDTFYQFKWFKGNKNNLVSTRRNFETKAHDTYYLVLEDSFGCQGIDSIVLSAGVMPEVDFLITNLCINQNAKFTGIAKNGASHLWLINDKKHTTATEFYKMYSDSGTYKYTFSAVSKDGCDSSISKIHRIAKKPTATIELSNFCSLDTITFKAISPRKAANYYWEFGDNATSTDPIAKHAYNFFGNPTVSVTLNKDSACSNTITQRVTISPKSKFGDFSPVGVCVNQNAAFKLSNWNNVNSVVWDFGDGNTSTVKSPSHTYTQSGEYSVKLKTITYTNCLDSVIKTVKVYNKFPTINFTLDDACLGQKSVIPDSIKTRLSNIYGLTFDWGGRIYLRDSTFKVPGTYNPKLILYFGEECSQELTTTNHVYDLPSADFTITKQSDNELLFEPAADTLASYSWVFGDGNTSNDVKPSHAYAASGNYLIELTTENTHGCTKYQSQGYTINIPIGINGIAEHHPIIVFPNPFSQQSTLQYVLSEPTAVRIEMVDLLGRTVYLQDLGMQSEGEHQWFMGKEMFPSSGQYLLKFTTNTQTETLRIRLD